MVKEARAIYFSSLVSKSHLTPFNNNVIMTHLLSVWFVAFPWCCPGYLSVKVSRNIFSSID